MNSELGKKTARIVFADRREIIKDAEAADGYCFPIAVGEMLVHFYPDRETPHSRGFFEREEGGEVPPQDMLGRVQEICRANGLRISVARVDWTNRQFIEVPDGVEIQPLIETRPSMRRKPALFCFARYTPQGEFKYTHVNFNGSQKDRDLLDLVYESPESMPIMEIEVAEQMQ